MVLGKLFGETVEIAGRYRLGEQIGRGGLGFVHRARDLKLDRDVALKFPKGASANPEIVADIEREAKVLARLQHPNIVAVYDVGRSEQGVYLAMELIDGVSMSQWLSESERSWQEVLEVMRAAGEGLAAAHEAGVVHRDFKPSNVMIDRAGRVRVVDFGLAREHAAELEDAVSSSASNPRRTSAAGTVPYMAPEQFDGDVTAASDQFAFCTTLFEGICGERLWLGRSRGVAPRDGASAATISRQVRRRGLPRRLCTVLVRGLALSPTERFDSMRALVDELSPSRTGARASWAVGGALVVGLAGFMARPPDECTSVENRGRVALAGTLADFEWPSSELEVEFDQFMSDWDAFEQATCRARVSGGLTTELLSARERCLDRKVRRLEFTFDELDEGAGRARGALAPALTLRDCKDDSGLLTADSEEEIDRALQDRIVERSAQADVMLGLGREREALSTLEQAYREWKDVRGATYGKTKLTLNYGALLVNRGELERATAVLEEQLVDVASQPHLAGSAVQLRALLAVALSFSQSHAHEARRLAMESRARLRGGEIGRFHPMAELAFARASALLGDDAAAREGVDQLLKVIDDYDPRSGRWHDHAESRLAFEVAAADVLALAGKREEAAQSYRAAISKLRAVGGRERALASALNNLGELESTAKPTPETAVLLEEAAEIKAQLGDRLGAAQSWRTAGTVHLRGGRSGDAVVAYEQALSLVPAAADHGERFEILYNLGLAHGALGETARSLAVLEEALADTGRAREVEPEILYFTKVAAAQAALKMQRRDVAETYHRQASALERPEFDAYARAELSAVGCGLATGPDSARARGDALRLARQAGDADLTAEAERCASVE